MPASEYPWDFLPPRYHQDWIEPFYELAKPKLTDGCRVLDFGAGAQPSIPIELRPENCHYVGLDVVREELEKAPEGSYDEMVVRDITESTAGLGDFDLVVSWQVMEHVQSMQRTADALYEVLAPGGLLVSQVSGKNGWFSRASRVIPQSISEYAMEKLLGREPETVFKTYYDRGTASEFREVFKSWQEVEVIPRYKGAVYLAFSKIAARVYLLYENWAVKRENLATHYLIRAVK